MSLTNLIQNNTDEMIAIGIVSAYIISWLIDKPMPTEPIMLILGFYFGRKI